MEDRGVWAIGDVHGCLQTLRKLCQRIQPRRCYLLGDLINKGPDSMGVLDYVRERPKTLTPLLGNQEDLLLQANRDRAAFRQFLASGGGATLHSFGVTHTNQIPESYIGWIASWPIVRRFGKVVLSHAGANLNAPKPFETTGKNRMWLLYNRQVLAPKDPDWTIVFGHTPVSLARAQIGVKQRKVMIDGGCWSGGNLIAYNLHTKELVHEPYAD